MNEKVILAGGICFIVGALAFVGIFSWLAAKFDYPQVLDGEDRVGRVVVVAHPALVKLVLLLTLLPLVAAADDKTLRVDYYAIEGASARELRAQMDRLGPVGEETGRRNDAYTGWHITWKYDFDARNGGCTAGNHRVDLSVTMTMPRWSPTPKAPPALRDLWARFLSALQRHEDGHYDRAIAAADEVRRALVSVGRDDSCDTLRSRLDGAANAVLDTWRRKQADYDRETDSGRRQGTNVL